MNVMKTGRVNKRKPMKLSDYEKGCLEGANGRLKQVAMENIVRYAGILGADELCEVTKATLFCGAHNYMDVSPSEDIHAVFAQLNLARDETIPFTETYTRCYAQSCVAPCDQYQYEPFGQKESFFQKNGQYLEQAKAAGVNIAGTCSPYLTGWIPIQGEHFVTTESGVTVLANSLWGAMGNSDGIEAAFWSAICGRTPRWGNHIRENRAGTHLIKVESSVESQLEWNLLGKAIGIQLPSGSIPVIFGNLMDVNFNKLRSLCTMLAISSNCEMCHIVGVTPEARTIEDAFQGRKTGAEIIVNDQILTEVFDSVCDKGDNPIDFVSLGCPHYDIDQIRRAAMAIKGKKVHENVHFMMWTVYPIKCMADENGYTKIIEEAGGHIYTSTCPSTMGEVFLSQYHGFVLDSLKMAGSLKSEASGNVYLGDMEGCIEAAVNGRWEERKKWKK